jgi:hypothetical protein
VVRHVAYRLISRSVYTIGSTLHPLFVAEGAAQKVNASDDAHQDAAADDDCLEHPGLPEHSE